MSSSVAECAEVGAEGSEELSGDVAFESADHFFLGVPFGESTLHVGLGVVAVAESDDDDHVEGSVGLAVAGVG